jgi:hypothetical protein
MVNTREICPREAQVSTVLSFTLLLKISLYSELVNSNDLFKIEGEMVGTTVD